jgi:hypothetical protein
VDIHEPILTILLSRRQICPQITANRRLCEHSPANIHDLHFSSSDFGEQCKKLFRDVAWLRPQATRPASREIYLIAKGRL